MGNSLLDLMVYGKRTGVTAAERAKSMSHGNLTLGHLDRFRAEARKHSGALAMQSPMLFPDYVRKDV
jgi:succinate dehydrogenase / fumarate reductase flavoprotein subunit/L-aspartate oxidase